jgi:hypothetical protein
MIMNECESGITDNIHLSMQNVDPESAMPFLLKLGHKLQLASPLTKNDDVLKLTLLCSAVDGTELNIA